MKLKQLLPSLLLLLLSLSAFAQNENPFASIGKKGKVLSLTKGQYNETFDADSIQQIGSSLINIRAMKVVKLMTDDESKKRLESEKHSKFLSIDPLTRNYPMLTPYQYASNRPIDGIDMDGLEYLTYTIVINKTTSKIQMQGYNWYNENQHNAHGNLGQGVLYNIRFYDEKNKSWSFKSVFRSRSGIGGSSIDEYGNYMGSTPLLKTDAKGNFIEKAYDYDLPAIDAVDQGAYLHDKGYDRVKSVGASGLFTDWATTPYDETALNGWNDILQNYQVGDKDPFNNETVTQSERNAAWRGSKLFSSVVAIKKNAISSFMTKNYGAEAKKLSTKFATNRDEVLEFNYQLFLSKYMKKDSDGNWIRNDDMWNKDKDGNYTTPKTSNK